jgi:ABC-2 type transport system ATP-binding protein
MPAISVRGLTKVYRSPQKEPGLGGALKSLFNRRYRETRAVADISFEISEGELVGFLGANGAGKTTTLKMLAGLLTPTSGEASVIGHTPWLREPGFQHAISLVMGQRSQLWWEIPAEETWRLNQAIYGVPETEYARSVDELVELLELRDCLGLPVKKLSLGQRMRAELAAALLHRPKILLLDEPTLGLDVVMQKKVREFIREYNRRHKAAVMLTSHNMDDVVALCPRVIVVERGAILYDGALPELVAKYAEHKVIRAVFETAPDPAKLGALGRVTEHDGLKASIEVPRKQVSKKAAELLQGFPVLDLNIEEPSVDEVVRRLFTRAEADL